MGAQAIATSSAAHAFTLGRPDMGNLTRDEALNHASDLVAAVNVPVQGDFENGFGEAPETCAETVRLAYEAGLAGICIEDTALPDDTPYGFDLAVDRIRAAAAAARALPGDFVLTARADGVMIGTYDQAEALRRLLAFEAAGADCLYAPVLKTMEDLGQICQAVKVPVNALIAGHSTHNITEFAALGVARISLGSSLARATHRLIHNLGRAMFDQGDFTGLGQAMSGDQVDLLLDQGIS
jgi:2-methylisocitrate lyase-like PEP mutase family enzyme